MYCVFASHTQFHLILVSFSSIELLFIRMHSLCEYVKLCITYIKRSSHCINSKRLIDLGVNKWINDHYFCFVPFAYFILISVDLKRVIKYNQNHCDNIIGYNKVCARNRKNWSKTFISLKSVVCLFFFFL